jgi:hypothetical protein
MPFALSFSPDTIRWRRGAIVELRARHQHVARANGPPAPAQISKPVAAATCGPRSRAIKKAGQARRPGAKARCARALRSAAAPVAALEALRHSDLLEQLSSLLGCEGGEGSAREPDVVRDFANRPGW